MVYMLVLHKSGSMRVIGSYIITQLNHDSNVSNGHSQMIEVSVYQHTNL